MRVDYDWTRSTVRFDFGEEYNIESLRRYCHAYHGESLKAFFIKVINSNGRRWTFDFDGFFHTIDIPFLRQYKKYLASCYDEVIKPVPNIRLNYQDMDRIYRATLQQYIIKPHDWKLLLGELSRSDGKSSQYPLISFVGICDMHGFLMSEILEFANLNHIETIEKLIRLFQKHIKENTRVKTKTHLILNQLNSYGPYVRVSDLGRI